jgi:hypothetical protein
MPLVVGMKVGDVVAFGWLGLHPDDHSVEPRKFWHDDWIKVAST